MFRGRRAAAGDRNTGLLWQALLIVPPVILLSAVALYSLRQDRATIEQEARRSAAVQAPDLARRWGARIQADLAALVAASCASGPSRSPQAPSANGESPECGLILNGRIRVPGDYPAIPTPPEWAVNGAAGPTALLGEWEKLRTAFQKGGTAKDAERLFDFAHRAEGVDTDSGAPVSDLALLLALGKTAVGALSDAQAAAVERHLTEYPSFLGGTLVEEMSRVMPGSPAAARIAARWTASEQALAPLRSVARAMRTDSPAAFWLDEGGASWLALVTPLGSPSPLTASSARSAQHVTLVPARRLERLLQALPAAGEIPDYATAAIEVGGRTTIAGPSSETAAPAVELASAPGRIDLPLTLPADAVPRFAGELLRVAPEALPVQQPSAAGTVRLVGLPGGYPFTLRLELTRPAALYTSYRTKLWLAAGLVLAATLAAFAGLAGTWRAYERQRRLSEMKSNFVASVSHELRAPIGSVRLMSESLERGTVTDEGRRNEYIRLIGQECRRLSSLVENVLDFSRIDRGVREFRFEPTDLGELVERTVEAMRPSALERRVTLAFTALTDGHGPCIRRLDGQAIQQALVNLIDNAVKHSPAEGTVGIALDARASAVRVAVNDGGPGIPVDEQERIFEPFYRRGSELRRETQGVGIGLAIARHIAEAHGGRITVESRPGEGASFAIELPALPEEPS